MILPHAIPNCRAMVSFLLPVILSLWVTAVPGKCLPEATAVTNRKYVRTLLGQDSALKFVALEPSFAQVLTAVAQVITEEILGYHVVIENHSNSWNGWISLAGCRETDAGVDCDVDLNHIVIGTIHGNAYPELHGEMPLDLGSLGFRKEERFWIKDLIQSTAFNEKGLVLEHFRTGLDWKLLTLKTVQMNDSSFEPCH